MSSISNPKLTLVDEWGLDDPEVESIWMLLKDAVSKLEDANLKDEADFIADRIYEKLREARHHYKIITSEKFLSRPISEQDAIYNALYSTLWSAYKDRLIKFLKAIGYEAGAIVAGEIDYEPQITAFCNRYQELGWLKNLIDEQRRGWQTVLRDNRNAQEHGGDLRDKANLPNLSCPDEAKRMFVCVASSIESIAICAISYKLPEFWSVIHLDENATVFDRRPRFKIDIAV